MKVLSYAAILIIIAFACNNQALPPAENAHTGSLLGDTVHLVTATNDSVTNTPPLSAAITKKDTAISAYEQMLIKAGLVDLQSIDSSILIDIKYAEENNFMGKDLYEGFKKCYLPPEVAYKVAKAQKMIQLIDGRLSIIIYDAVRPRSVQRRMWEELDMPFDKKKRFLAKPEIISLHNFGAAVDASLCYKGKPMDMGTEFDYAGELAYPILEQYFLEKGHLKQNQVMNREILREAMVKAGFIYNRYEWWHFSACKRNIALQKYALIDDFSSFSVPDKFVAEATDTSDYVIFKVQLAAAASPLKPAHKIFSLKDVGYYKHNNMYKYTSGSFRDLGEAYSYRDSILDNVYEQAFIVCFHKGERIHIRDAIALLE